MKTSGIVLTIVLILLHPVSARAAVIFSNLTSAPSAYTNGWGVSGPAVSGALAQTDVGSPFLTSQAATLDTIEVALKYDSGPNRFDILLLSDDHGLPGSLLEILTAINVPSTLECPSSCVLPLTVVTSLAHPVLEANTEYWIAATAYASTIGAFMINLTGDTGVAYRNYGGPWIPALAVQNTAVAFAVSGTPVGSQIPEPASVMILGIAAGALLTRRKVRRNLEL